MSFADRWFAGDSEPEPVETKRHGGIGNPYEPEPVETVTTAGGNPVADAWARDEMLAEFSEVMDALDRVESNKRQTFDVAHFRALCQRQIDVLREMRDEGARIRKERGSGR